MRECLRKLPFDVNDTKVAVFLITSKEVFGFGGVNVSTKDNYIVAHGGVFIVVHSRDIRNCKYLQLMQLDRFLTSTFFIDYYYEPRYQIPDTRYKPMKFIGDMTSLAYSTKFHIIFGNQIDSNDCLARCFSFMKELVNGKNDLKKLVGMTYDLTKRRASNLSEVRHFLSNLLLMGFFFLIYFSQIPMYPYKSYTL